MSRVDGKIKRSRLEDKRSPPRLTAILLLVGLSLVILSNVHVAHAATTTTKTLTVSSETTSGSTISGLYVVLEQDGGVISTGFTPVSWKLDVGDSYQILAEDYGQYSFSEWSSGDTSDPTTITASSSLSSLTAIYSSSGGGGSGVPSSITVNSVNTAGGTLSGLYVALEQSGTVINTGFTPVTFSVVAGDSYQISAESYGQYTFSQWSTGDTSDPTTVVAPSGADSITAIYSSAGSGPSTITVDSVSGGSSLTGMYIALEQGGSVVATGFTPVTFSLVTGDSYQILAYNYGQYTFSQWSDGNTVNPDTITASGSITLMVSYSTPDSTGPVPPQGITGGSSGLGIVIPLYVYPNSVWQSVVNYHEEYPSVPMLVVINPSGGPGSYDPTFASWVSTLQGDGITVLGYVSTEYTAAPISQVESEIYDYASWYGVHGLFIDDMENVPGYEWYYEDVASYAASVGISFIMGNPGTSVSTTYVGIFTDIGTYENSGAPSVALIQSYTYGLSASGWSFIAYNAALPSQSYFDSMAQYVSWVYVTDQTNSWTSLPSYMAQEMAELAAA